MNIRKSQSYNSGLATNSKERKKLKNQQRHKQFLNEKGKTLWKSSGATPGR